LQFFTTPLQTASVGADVIAVADFQNYVLSMSRDSITVTQLSFDATKSMFLSKTDVTDSSVGLRSEHSFKQFKNSFYIVTKDKRLSALSITPVAD
jgi:hypothetical protein